jgi:hypothetical protein
MKAQELRIGNIFHWESTQNIDIVKDIVTYNKRVTKINNVSIFDCKPILLTRDWILKFDFELRDGKYYKGKYLIEDGISQYFNNGYSFRITIDNQNSTHASSVKYVHQLQNLYFALTGQELELK